MTKADTNLHTIAGSSVVIRDNNRYTEYRNKWNEWPEKYITEKFPLHLDVEATNLCNLKCPFCENTFNKYRYGRMPRNIWKSIVAESGEENLYSLKFSLRGEPLLHPDLPRMIKEAKDAGVLDVYFNTNGVKLDEATSRKVIEAGIDRISISFEGYQKEVYEKYRVGARFDDVVKNIRTFREVRDATGNEKPYIRIQTVMVPEMVGRGREYSDFWKPVADEIAYLDMRDEESNPDHTGKLSDWACPQLWQRMSITWDGNILPCVQDIFEKMSPGNVLDISIKDAWNGQQVQQYRNLHRSGRSHEISSCDRCAFRENEISKLKKNC